MDLRNYRRSKKILLIAVLLLMTIVILTACNPGKDNPFEAEGFAMGTIISQKVYGPNTQQAADEVLEKIKYLENLMTFNAPNGDIYKLNQNAGQEPIKINSETAQVLQVALEFAELSKGAFDPTVGPVVKSWDIGGIGERIPSPEELQKLKALINYQDVYLDDSIAGLQRSGQMIDLGGIAKGYAGDAALEIYKENGCNSALLNLGGNVVALGSRPDGNPWNIGIQNPRSVNGEVIGFVKVTDKAVVTSGDYQRYFEKDGKRYHHIIDPHTGFPAESGLMSVTLISSSSLKADAFSTAVFIMGLEKGRELIQKDGQAEAIFITNDKEVYVTEGLQGSFQFLDESNEYTYVKEG